MNAQHPVQTMQQSRALAAYTAAHRDVDAAREERFRRLPLPEQPTQPEPANFCAAEPGDLAEREPFDWIDSAVFLCCGALVAAVVLVASWAGWLA